MYPKEEAESVLTDIQRRQWEDCRERFHGSDLEDWSNAATRKQLEDARNGFSVESKALLAP